MKKFLILLAIPLLFINAHCSFLSKPTVAIDSNLVIVCDTFTVEQWAAMQPTSAERLAAPTTTKAGLFDTARHYYLNCLKYSEWSKKTPVQKKEFLHVGISWRKAADSLVNAIYPLNCKLQNQGRCAPLYYNTDFDTTADGKLAIIHIFSNEYCYTDLTMEGNKDSLKAFCSNVQSRILTAQKTMGYVVTDQNPKSGWGYYPNPFYFSNIKWMDLNSKVAQ